MTNDHYHVLAGIRGCMPDYNEPYVAKLDAKDDMMCYIDTVEMCCDMHEINPIIGFSNCTTSFNSTYAEFAAYHGVEYVEVAECNLPECMELIER